MQKSKSIFKAHAAPANDGEKFSATWLTWSDEFVEDYLKAKADCKGILPTVQLEFIEGFNEYNYSYTIANRVACEPYFNKLKPYIANLYNFPIGEEVHCFSDLINETITALDFHTIFALLRAGIVETQNNQMEALYAPLTTSNSSYFPLHCDLYIPKILFNVYEDVPPDDSGKSLFLLTSVLIKEILPTISEMPNEVRETLEAILDNAEPIDNYQEFYDLLNSPMNVWFLPLRNQTEARMIQHKFERGQGYMVHDRKWLHGRTKPKKVFSVKRLHRLIFNTLPLETIGGKEL